jgi:hypothetical protein
LQTTKARTAQSRRLVRSRLRTKAGKSNARSGRSHGRADRRAFQLTIVRARRRGHAVRAMLTAEIADHGMVGRCAWAPSGHAAAPPNSVMLSAERTN